MIKFQQSQALPSHFEIFWNIVSKMEKDSFLKMLVIQAHSSLIRNNFFTNELLICGKSIKRGKYVVELVHQLFSNVNQFSLQCCYMIPHLQLQIQLILQLWLYLLTS